MQIFVALVLCAVAFGPLYVAWVRGDAILNRLEAWCRRKQLMKRLRSTRRLPVREADLKRLLDGQTRLETIDRKVADALQRLSQLPSPAALQGRNDPARMLQSMEGALLLRESRFTASLETACAQSEALEVMEHEVGLLRRTAGLPETWPEAEPPPPNEAPSQPPPRDAAPAPPADAAAVQPKPPSPAAEKLMQSLREASRRRKDLDSRLSQLGTPESGAAPRSSTRSFLA